MHQVLPLVQVQEFLPTFQNPVVGGEYFIKFNLEIIPI